LGQQPSGEKKAPAQHAPEPVRPPLLFRETWKEPANTNIGHATPEAQKRDDENRMVTQNNLTNPDLELKLYGPESKMVAAY
jgi:hypothetical protein